jgi:hypothetical protein
MAMVVELPPGLADMPAGPELDAALDAIDPAHLCHDEALTVLEAEERQDGARCPGNSPRCARSGDSVPARTDTFVGYRIPANGPTGRSPPW